jgi:3-oxoacyl-[acyl-carrier-protein] synthase III
MGTIIEDLHVVTGSWRSRHSALRLAVTAGKRCLQQAGRKPNQIDLLVNAGIYRDRNLGEPALAALIQGDIGANNEDPHTGAHGTFSFDVANGTCGVLTALEIVERFLRTHTIDCALIVASDADPGHGLSEDFPFSPVGAALLCSWAPGDFGFSSFHWVNCPDGGDNFRATVEFDNAQNILRFHQTEEAEKVFAAAAAEAAYNCLANASLSLGDIDIVVAVPAARRCRLAIANQLDLPLDRVNTSSDERAHTASLVAALSETADQRRAGCRVLLITAGAGVTAGAALYRQP